MRLDHLLSKGRRSKGLYTVESLVLGGEENIKREKDSGADTPVGNTRTHPEHDG